MQACLSQWQTEQSPQSQHCVVKAPLLPLLPFWFLFVRVDDEDEDEDDEEDEDEDGGASPTPGKAIAIGTTSCVGAPSLSNRVVRNTAVSLLQDETEETCHQEMLTAIDSGKR